MRPTNRYIFTLIRQGDCVSHFKSFVVTRKMDHLIINSIHMISIHKLGQLKKNMNFAVIL